MIPKLTADQLSLEVLGALSGHILHKFEMDP